MRVLVISDIHANLAAFEAVLADAEGQWDTIWFLGDLVGYGPSPNECADLLRQHKHLALSGNHDWAVLNRLDIDGFNPEAKQAITWTQNAISEETYDYLVALDSITTKGAFTLAHGSLREPVWEYVLNATIAAQNFDYLTADYALVGHTHVPIVYEQISHNTIGIIAPNYRVPLPLNGRRLIINPGSVGQPRDSDPRAAYGMLDTEANTFQFRRVSYPVSETQSLMRKLGLPERLVVRLAYGW